ncbi:vomeronasal type-2 receptor 26-like isoform X2 [Ranitomeya variabilis]|uniref:vomeronasal type-2 receptor 26-like isoform X2 n=1 Tax=Ranitomeya variabilis TaxID=490064 RepID=UPI00405645FC
MDWTFLQRLIAQEKPMKAVLTLILLCVFWIERTENKSVPCTLKIYGNRNRYVKDGDLILGGVFQLFQFTYGRNKQMIPMSLLCYIASPRFLRHFLAVDFAIEEINQNINILPNISLGYDIFDSCFFEQTAVEGTLKILSGGTDLYPNYNCRKKNTVVAFIGHLLSSSSQVIAYLLNIYGYSQVSYGATDPIFSDRVLFPFFFRTVPNKQVMNRALVKLLKHFGWTWVGIVYSADDSNQKATEELIPLILKNDGCVAFAVKIYQDLVRFLRHVSFETNAGDKIYFNENGETPGHLDVLNWLIFPNKAIESVNVGRYFSEQLTLNDSSFQWPPNSSVIPRSVCTDSCPSGFRKSGREGEAICCYNCVPCSAGEISNTTDMDNCIVCPEDKWPNIQRNECIPKTVIFLSFPDPLGVTLTTSSAICFIIAVVVLGIFTVYRETPIVKASNRDLSYILLLSLMISFLCTLMFIGRPTTLNCISRQVTFCIVFTLSVSSTLAKNIAILAVFKSTKPENKLWPKFLFPKVIILLCCLNQVTICAVWLSGWPPFPESDTNTELGKIILQCNEGSTLAFYMALGYIGLLAFFSFILAFCVRKLPDRYNEAHHITFSMFVFCVVWITFIPVYLRTKGKYLVALEMFAILESSFGLLVCIFIPKCYTIILKPEMNIRDKIHIRSG